jgi:hypothetical protein
MSNIGTGLRECVSVGGVRGCVVGKADAGRTGVCEEVTARRMRTWADDVCDASGDTPNICSGPLSFRAGARRRRGQGWRGTN